MIYRVVMSDPGQEDMAEIYSYICDELLSPTAALNQYTRIARGITGLSQNPLRTRVIDVLKDEYLIRRLLVDKYSIFYTVRQTDVVVLRVLYTASDIDTKLHDDTDYTTLI